MMELYQVHPSKLDGWIADHLQPSEEFRKNVQEAIDRICSCLKEKGGVTVIRKIIKAGSTGKGTTLIFSSDADLVIFLSCFSSYQDLKVKRESVIKTIEEILNKHSQSIAYNIDIQIPQAKAARPPRSLTLTIQSKKKKELVEMDILPAYDVLGQITQHPYQPPPKVYEELITAGGQPGEFNTCFTELQRDFVKERPAKVKSLLRLVKHWYKESKENIRKENPSAPLPTKYALELLTIYAWEEGTSKAECFKTEEGFCTVMKLLTQYQYICLYWSKYYSLENHIIGPHVKAKLQTQRPVIIDPADPTGDVGKGKGWDVLAKEAINCMNQECCKRGGEPVKSWSVQPATAIQVKVKLLTGKFWEILCSPYDTISQIKEKMERVAQISVPEQRLCLQGPQQETIVLQNDKSLANYGVFYNVTLLLCIEIEIEIFVKDLQGVSRVFRVLPGESVLGLKRKIEERVHIPVNQQKLVYNSKVLDDNNTLASYNIRSKDTVSLTATLRGGNVFCQL